MANTKQTRRVPQRQRDTLFTTLETLPGAFFVLDETDTIVYANASAQAMLSVPPEMGQKLCFWRCAPYLVSPALSQAVHKTKLTGTLTSVQYVSPGTGRWLHVHLAPAVGGLTLQFHEVRAPARCREMFPQGEHLGLADLDGLQTRIAILMPSGIVLDITAVPLNDAQVRREEVLGKPLTAAPWWSSAPLAQEQLRTAIEQASRGETVHFETHLCPRPEKGLDLAVTLTPQYTANQQIEYLICTGYDITPYKRVEAELRALVDAVPNFVWIRRPDGSIAYKNRRWYDYAHEMAEYDSADARFQPLSPTDQQCLQDLWSTDPQTGSTADEATSLRFVHPEDRGRVMALQHQGWERGEPYAFDYRLRDGHTGAYRWFLSRGVPVRNEEGQIVHWVGTCTDITGQKHTEEALRQSQERVNHLMNSSVIGIFFAEGDEIVEANSAFLRITGYSRDDLSQRRLTWERLALPALKTSLTQQAYQEVVMQQCTTPFEAELVCKDGSCLDVLMGGVAFHGKTLQGIGFALDNSARKELDRRRDNFLSMASHELRTPLTAVKIQTQLMRKRLVRQGLHESVAALARMEEPLALLERLIGELLDVTRIQAGRLEYHWEPVDLDALLQNVADTMQQMDPTHRIAMRGTVSRLLLGDKGRLEQVFLNLLSNAIKYAPDAPLIEIEASASAEITTIAVRDYGIGIPKEQHEKIFELFYRVSDLSQRMIPGLGMGLCIASEIVAHHGGTITVDSEVGKGSTFTVTFPTSQDEVS